MELREPMASLGVSSVGKLVASGLLDRSVRGRLLQGRGVVFMLHRFTHPDARVHGVDPQDLRAALAYLRRQRHDLVPLEQLFVDLRDTPSRVRGGIAFTIDDGYADQARIGAPVFAEYDCPVTTFVTSGFLDRTLWFWWDRIAFLFDRTTANRLHVRVGERSFDYAWASPGERETARAEFTARCKVVPNAERLALIEQLAIAADVCLPETAPDEYAPMGWDELRSCEQRGMSFAPHTVTHPILSRTSDEQSMYEIAESWERLRAEARSPVKVFCYPNGQPDDHGAREWSTLARLDFLGAVVGTPGYVDASAFRNGTARYLLPRYDMPQAIPDVAQLVSGVERVKQLLTGRT